MKIVFTGGGTGGHFYPIIAVAQSIRTVVKHEKLIEPRMYFLAPEPYSKGELFNNNITYKKIYAGKMRIYSSSKNVVDMIKTGIGIVRALWTMFWIYPDVVFSKGGYGSFPVVVAARILRIPVIVHESDSAPGRVNAWTGRFAKKIALSYPEASEYFAHKDRIAWTGNPIRDEIKRKTREGGHEFLNLNEGLKTILVLGGSQGARKINDSLIDVLPQLLPKYQIVHQTGKEWYKEMQEMVAVTVEDETLRSHYKGFPYLNNAAMRTAAGVADLVITRAGSTLFEVSNWNIPAIVVPITESNANHQRKNAYAYARSGAGIVIEEDNLTPTVLIQEIERILEDPIVSREMIEGAQKFAKTDAADKLAEVILDVVLQHEK